MTTLVLFVIMAVALIELAVFTLIALIRFLGHLVAESNKRRTYRALVQALTKEKYNDINKNA